MLFGYEALRDRERELRQRADDRRRVVAARERTRPVDLDAEIRTLIEREPLHVTCPDCVNELTRAG